MGSSFLIGQMSSVWMLSEITIILADFPRVGNLVSSQVISHPPALHSSEPFC